jgi:hypothetical protein
MNYRRSRDPIHPGFMGFEELSHYDTKFNLGYEMPLFFSINMCMFLTMHTNFATVGGNFCRSRTAYSGPTGRIGRGRERYADW